MVEGIGVITDVILAKLQKKMIPAKEKYSTLITAICCGFLGLGALFTSRFVYAIALLIGTFVFFGKYRTMTNKVFREKLAVAAANNNEVARYKVRFGEEELTVMTMEGDDPTDFYYQSITKRFDMEEAVVLMTHKGQMIFISKTETDPDALEEILDIIDDRCYNIGYRTKGEWL